MKIPDKIKIGGHSFDIHFTEDVDGFDIMGQGRHWSNRINIQMAMAQSKKESTLLHEALHEMNLQQGWDLDENKISAMAESFYQFLTDNGFLT